MSKNYNSITINGRSGSNSNSSNYGGNSYPSGSDRGGNRGYGSGEVTIKITQGTLLAAVARN